MATRASERWKVLRRAIRAAKRETDNDTKTPASSGRSFGSFSLFQVSTDASNRDQSEQWLSYSFVSGDLMLCEASVKILQAAVSLEDMVGFNNTGNVCVWPAEEVLAHHCLEHRELFKEATVCELGCGMTGLAGLMLACSKVPSHVLLTDGNEVSVKNVQEIVSANRWRFEGSTEVFCEVIRWENLPQKEDHAGKFDYVLCADCLFFREVHLQLVVLIQKLLKPLKGTAILFAPRRGHTLEQFCDIAKNYFQVDCVERYSEQVWKVHEDNPHDFNIDLHYPLKIILKQKL